MNAGVIALIVVILAVMAALSLISFIETDAIHQVQGEVVHKSTSSHSSSFARNPLNSVEKIDHNEINHRNDMATPTTTTTTTTTASSSTDANPPAASSASAAKETPPAAASAAASADTIATPIQAVATALVQRQQLPAETDPNAVVIHFDDHAGLQDLVSHFFAGSLCSTLMRNNKDDETLETYNQHATLIDVKIACQDLLQVPGGSALGMGNVVTALYGVRMIAHALGPQTDVSIQCADASDTQGRQVLPWLTGKFPRRPGGDAVAELPSMPEACQKDPPAPLGHLWRDMVWELRRMSIALVGVPSPDHPSAAWAATQLWGTSESSSRHGHGPNSMQLSHPRKDDAPMFPNTALDDVVLHFRCHGDLMESSNFGFMKFGSYSRHIPPEVRTIGIVTQDLDPDTSQQQQRRRLRRRLDEKSFVNNVQVDHCPSIVSALVQHLQEKFPNAKVTVYEKDNQTQETMSLTLARMVMANQTIVGITSLGAFPAVATFGKGFIRKPDYLKAPSRWLVTSNIVERAGNVQWIEEPRLMSHLVANKWGNDGAAVLEWFRNYDVSGATLSDEPIPVDTGSTATLTETASQTPPADTATATTTDTPPPAEQDEAERFDLPSTKDPTAVVIRYYNSSGMNDLANHFFQGAACRTYMGNDTTPEQYNQHSTLVEVKFNCFDLYKNSGLGTGNFLSAFYGIRMAAHALGNKTDVWIECDDAEAMKDSLILPWMMGKFPPLSPGDPDYTDQPTKEEACRDYKSVPIGYRWRDMKFELRRMAIAMVGIPSPDHPSAAWAEENLWSNPATGTHRHGRDYMLLPHPKKGETPIFPNTQLDDAVLHFRCGDIIASNHPSFGFMKFGSFSRHLSPEVRTIGVVTQPFEHTGQQRRAEGGAFKLERCRKVVYAFVDHLQAKFPAAKVSIWNDVNETIALTFARMIMANQTVIGITSFGVFPGVTTFGRGYIRKPDYPKAPNRWLLTSPIVERTGNVELVDEPRLMAQSAKKLWGHNGSALIEWFENYNSR